ncbi:hypothetical protein OVY01_20350 [Robbsia sp. Bb-Pol-6]|uniref:Uncharacterized protein n=1 Tax=Robbsia betulipollinis TaxID=2981849 RepID=A0ABT3ZSI3_9BURK|nr:hypothetical protein [Robbsia betulipollinis]MCY0389500.1 hypothetical protein [Robbsia betulipollinis]
MTFFVGIFVDGFAGFFMGRVRMGKTFRSGVDDIVPEHGGETAQAPLSGGPAT